MGIKKKLKETKKPEIKKAINKKLKKMQGGKKVNK